MFEKTEIKKPNYTARMLLSRIDSEKAKSPLQLKPFSHFTLACTHMPIQRLKIKHSNLLSAA